MGNFSTIFRRCAPVLAAFFLSTPLTARAQQTFTNFQAASVVAGQVDFTSQATTASQTVTPGPTSVAISALGKMAVGEQSGARTLIWNSITTSNGTPANVVVGKPDFTSTLFGCTASLTSYVEGVTFSPDGSKLIVCDAGNNRVLIWNSLPTVNGQPADVVIGQTNFTSSTTGVAANKLSYPSGVLVTPDGKLVVVELTNNRVLIYNSIPTSNGASADVVVGQTNMTSNSAGSGASQLSRPWHCAYSGDGKLLVSEEGNNRVLVFNALPASNGTAADVVIGQAGFGSSGAGTTASRLAIPIGVTVSPAGQLAIGEFLNNRVLIYNAIPTGNGAAADVVLGQPNFTSNTAFNGGVSAQSMSRVYQPAFAADGRLLVSGRDMHRVMVFGNPGTPPAVVTLAATNVLPAGAVLNGTADPLGLNTDAAFEIATVPSMAGAVVTSSQNVGSASGPVPVSFPVTGLVPNTTYYFRIVATNSAGTSRGLVHSFLTPVIVWGGAGANAATGTLDATIIPADTFTPVPAPVIYTNVAGQNYDIATTTYRLGAVGPATFPATVAGSPAWFFQGTGPSNSGYAAVTFRFFQTGTSNPVGVTGVRFRLEDAETGERFLNFSYWDAIGNKITVPFTDSLFTYSSPATFFNSGYGVINGAGYEGGTQTGKWIDIDLSLRAISGFEILSHRQTSSAGSVVMTNWGGGALPMNVWRQAQFGASWTNNAISGDFADPNSDGIINLIAYAFGIPPLGPTSGGLPVVGVSGGYATITFTRPLSVTDLSYHVEVSGDMITWLPGSFYASTGDVPSNANTTQLSRVVGATTETIMVRDNTLIGSGRYIRVRVTRP